MYTNSNRVFLGREKDKEARSLSALDEEAMSLIEKGGMS